MPLVDQSFGDTFSFSRPRWARYRVESGLEADAAPGEPCFDHTAAGEPRGLKVDGAPGLVADRLRVIDGDWNAPKGTVLHEMETPAGEVVRRAFYAPASALATANACLAAKGTHRRIAYVAKYLPNRGGWVRWRNQRWALGGLVTAHAGAALGFTNDAIMTEG